MEIGQSDFERLLQLRTTLRRFLRFSERQARQAGVTPAQHQLMLAVRGHPDPAGPTVSDVADYLVLRHNSAVGLIDRAAAAGLVRRAPDEDNGSVVRVRLTSVGSRKLELLSAAHLEELTHLAPIVGALMGAAAARQAPADWQ